MYVVRSTSVEGIEDGGSLQCSKVVSHICVIVFQSEGKRRQNGSPEAELRPERLRLPLEAGAQQRGREEVNIACRPPLEESFGLSLEKIFTSELLPYVRRLASE